MRNYIKPLITFESVAVSPRIATSCSLIATNNAAYLCPVIDEEVGWRIFADYLNCDEVVENNDQVCYDIPLVGSNVFQS